MKKFLPLIIIAAIFMVYRFLSYSGVDFPINSAPIAALFLCAVFYAGSRGLAVAGIVWCVSYPVLSFLQGYGIGADLLASLVGLAIIISAAFFFKKSSFSRKPWVAILGGSLASAALFYFITNCFSWIALPLYEKNLTGFYQAQWAGHPDLAMPTWMFLRNSLIGNGVFALLVLLAQFKLPFSATRSVLKEAH